MSDDNARWEPVGAGYEYATPPSIGEWRRKLYCRDGELGIIAINDDGTEDDERWLDVDLPPDIRLCRAKLAPQWSQEPPTHEGWWWHWTERGGVSLLLIESALGGGPLWNSTDPMDDMMYPVHRTRNVPGHYWLPATVPQPPSP